MTEGACYKFGNAKFPTIPITVDQGAVGLAT